MNSSTFTIFIFAAAIVLRCLSSTGALTCHPDDEAGLLAFKAGIKDSVRTLSNWKKGTHCCSWNGVRCDNPDRVTGLYVSGTATSVSVVGKSLSGTISPSLAKLQHLERVFFSDLGKITGSFPQFLLKLPKLKFLDIRETHLSGPLPTNLGALSKLEELVLQNNRFTGPIPSSLSNLTWVSLFGNRLSGTIPDIFKSFPSLTHLDLSWNRFIGELPPSLASVAPTLDHLDVSHNNLSGTIPNYLSRFKMLFDLDLSSNRFSGVVPMGFTNLTSIAYFNISHNLLTGSLPSLRFANGIIESLDLSYNKFQLKTIPKWVTSSDLISHLKLAKCGIKMNLDDWKPKINQSVSYIDLSENEISGSPVRFVNRMDTLWEFYASGNKLRFNLGNLNFTKSLSNVDLSRNLVFGKVPASVAGLETLNLSHNHLCGKLPVTKFPASVFAGNDCLCGSPLSPCNA